ncbi:YutD family protein [Amphibacillus indicireducens]|uniref:YutD family protein n=1 Tax=Amphibacillus indicireducens TaxID=1076330 RepID=A0ABP7VII3_9BACI
MIEEVVVEGQVYQLVENYKSGFDKKVFAERYSDILAKYDFIVGDWGYDQLRLKGFFDDQNPKATFDTKAAAIDDYLLEYCNFGCAYFVVKRIVK